MKIYQVVYENQYGERVADFGFYEAYLDAEERAFEVRMKTSMESGHVRIDEIQVHEKKYINTRNTYCLNEPQSQLEPYPLKECYAS